MLNVKKKKDNEDLGDGKDDDKKNDKTAVDTEYIVQGDGQFTIHVMSVKDRDKALAKRAKEQVKMEHKLELEDQSNKKTTKSSQSTKDKPAKEKPSKEDPSSNKPSTDKPANDSSEQEA